MRRFLNELSLWLECWTGWIGLVLLVLVAIATLPLWIFFADRVALLGQRLEAWARQKDREHKAEWDALAVSEWADNGPLVLRDNVLDALADDEDET